MKISVLDLGTNTFNLLIAETIHDSKFKIVFTDRYPVKLGSKGITSGKITAEAYNRGITAIQYHYQSIKKFKTDRILAFATSAIRSAVNGPEFIKQIEEEFNIRPEIISGDREAELIFKGVRLAVPFNPRKKNLIMDIGGGSVELIIADIERILWKESYSLGVARLLEKFNLSDPITSDEITEFENYIKHSLSNCFQAVYKFNPEILIGSSGSFDTFADLILKRNPDDFPYNEKYVEILNKDFQLLHQKLILSTLDERLTMPAIPEFRAEMIVIASIFVNFIVKQLGIKRMFQSQYALKEGAISEITGNSEM